MIIAPLENEPARLHKQWLLKFAYASKQSGEDAAGFKQYIFRKVYLNHKSRLGLMLIY